MLSVSITPDVEAKLRERAAQSGREVVEYAADLIRMGVDAPMIDELGENGATPDERLRFFREWVASLPARPGPPVDASRAGIYD